MKFFLSPLRENRTPANASDIRARQIGVRRSSLKRRLLLEKLNPRLVLANVAGVVFEDINQSWAQDGLERPLADRLVFADLNRNGSLDENEPLRITDQDGRFEFQELSGDEAIIRLFGGPSSGTAVFPLEAESPVGILTTSQPATSVQYRDHQAFVIAGSSILRLDALTGDVATIEIPSVVRSAQWLPDGRILVLASDDLGNHAFTIANDNAVNVIDLQTPAPVAGWSDVAVDASGNGVLVVQSEEESQLRAVAFGDEFAIGTTTTTVGAGTQLISGGELTTIISTPTDAGLQLRLWSNATGTLIGDTATTISGAEEVLSYRDSSGLVLLRTSDSVTVLDAAAGFATLQSIPVQDSVAALDHSRELLYLVSPGLASLQVIELQSAAIIADLAIEPQLVAGLSNLAFDESTQSLVLLTSAGAAPLTLTGSRAHRVRLNDEAQSRELRFGLTRAAIENSVPRLDQPIALTTSEDTALVVGSPNLLAGATDDDGDPMVVLLGTAPQNGIAVITPTGGLGYVPDPNFNGTDQLSIILHDGVAATSPIPVTVTITSVNDPPILNLTPRQLFENATTGTLVATLEIINPDGGPVQVTFDDPRFTSGAQGVLVASNASFDFESEPIVSVNVTARNTSSGESTTKSLSIPVADVDESIQDIQPDAVFVDENRPGELIAEVFVVDDGEGVQYDFSIDDERFEVLFRDLRLKPGISLDYEAEPTVTIHITATSATGATKTEPIVITVRDIAEQASTVGLSREAVVELVRGATVGDIIIDGNPLGDSYIATVDDTRFEIVGGTLKLRTSEFVRYADQQEIQVVITVQDASATFLPVAGTISIDVLVNENPFHNSDNPYDVNGDGNVTPLDALLIINSMSQNGGPGPISRFPSPDRYYDVNGDGLITALDALLIINYLNRVRRGQAEREGAPEEAAPITQTPPTPAPRMAAQQFAAPVVQNAELPGPIAAHDTHPPIQQSAKKVVVASEQDLVQLRDEVIELLANDELSDDAEVATAIADFLPE